ncbi:MAG: diaminopropionate ammonia-lyase [Actinomycetota bacterium]|nr:diaminopropionate ammonia-lyase [Actinomycetota bacterium]
MRGVRVLHNQDVPGAWNFGRTGRDPLSFHRRLPGYEPTPLADAPGLAKALGVGRVWVKDESYRLGLPAFKILGASWAAYRALEEHSENGIGAWDDLERLREQIEPLRPLAFAAATDGNHGRAVARLARLLGLEARIFVPADMVAPRVEAIMAEGAAVTVVDGGYDEAVARSAEEAGERCLVISDTAWPGYEEVPRWVIEGYSTILWEVEDELARRGEPAPDLVVAQIGVGAFAAAVVGHFRAGRAGGLRILGVEPQGTACMLASVEAGHIVSLPAPRPSIMAGLNCGTPSRVAWPIVSKGVDAFISIEDEWARRAMRLLARAGLASGETGGAGLAGLLALAEDPEQEPTRGLLGMGEEATVLLFNCEGPTDPDAYASIVADEGAS